MLAVELEQRLHGHLDVVLLPDQLRSVLECETTPSLQRVTCKQLLLKRQQLLSPIWTRVECPTRLEVQATPDVVAEGLVAGHYRDVQQQRYLLVRELHSAHITVASEAQEEDALYVGLLELAPAVEGEWLLLLRAPEDGHLSGLNEFNQLVEVGLRRLCLALLSSLYHAVFYNYDKLFSP